MSSNKIAKLLQNYLLTKHEAYVPGLGRFYALPQKAVLSPTEAKLSPPQIQYFFEDYNSNDSDFIVFVSEMLQTNFAKAEKKVGKFTQDVFNRLLNYQRATIPYIGELVQSEDSSIEYKPDQELLKLETAYLPDITIRPINRVEKEKETIIQDAISANKVYQSEFAASGTAVATVVPEEKDVVLGRRWTDYLLSAFLILVLILGMRSCFKLYNENQLRNSTFTSDTIGDSNDSVQSAEMSLDVQQDAADGADKIAADDSTLESDRDEGNSTENTDLDESDTANATPSESKVYANGTTDEIIKDGCIIIVGSFSKFSNIGKMTSVIESKGLQLYTEQNVQGLTRVGFRFDCNQKSDLESYLSSVRVEFGTNAWYLSPNIEVY